METSTEITFFIKKLLNPGQGLYFAGKGKCFDPKENFPKRFEILGADLWYLTLNIKISDNVVFSSEISISSWENPINFEKIKEFCKDFKPKPNFKYKIDVANENESNMIANYF